MTKGEKVFEASSDLPEIVSSRITEVVARASDIALVIDGDGIIQGITVNPDTRELGCLDHWAQRDIRSFLTEESARKLEARIAEARRKGAAAVRAIELNHVDNANWEFPIRYTLHETGREGALLLMGRDLRPMAEVQQQLVSAQLALERDYEKYRDIESRYRVLMDQVRDAVVVVECGSGRIAEINGTAAQLLGADVQALTGSSFAQVFEGRQRNEFIESLRSAGTSETPQEILAETRRARRQVRICPRLFRAAGEMLVLCRVEAVSPAEAGGAYLGRALTLLYRHAPDAIVFTDPRGDIVDANEAFLILGDVAQLSDIAGEPLADFFQRGSVDVKVMLDNAARTGRMRHYASKMKSAIGTPLNVEVSATHLRDRGDAHFAFVIRDTSRVDAGGPPPAGVSDEAVQNVIELVGTAPLKELVSATTDVVEKLCIETAVQLTNNNRVAAAEMLGLSRQSLYVKLRKYGLLNKSGED